jgi:hypothetical protein
MTVLWGDEKQLVRCRKHEKIEKVTGSPTAGRGRRDEEFVGVSTENILNKLALMGLRPG